MRLVLAALLVPTLASAKAGPASLPELIAEAEIVAVGTVEEIVSDDTGAEFARMRVKESWRGDSRVGDVVTFLSSRTWSCDVTYARRGERKLVFLAPLLTIETYEEETCVDPPEPVRDERLWRVLHSGYGAAHVDIDERGQLRADVAFKLDLPPGIVDDDEAGFVSLADLREVVRRCAKKRCDATSWRTAPLRLSCHKRAIATYRSGPRRCRVFDEWAVLDDGRGTFEVRPRGASDAATCAEDAPLGVPLFSLDGLELASVTSKWLTFEGDDAIGPVLVMDAATGESVHESYAVNDDRCMTHTFRDGAVVFHTLLAHAHGDEIDVTAALVQAGAQPDACFEVNSPCADPTEAHALGAVTRLDPSDGVFVSPEHVACR